MRITCISFQIAFAYEVFFFYFDASIFGLHCSWISYKRLEYTHGFVFVERELVLQIILFYYINIVLVKNVLIARHGHIFCHICGFVCFWSSN
jgi:hypothetical protein